MSHYPAINFNDSECPGAYKEGFINFYELKFKVTPDVLIPRPETEQLVTDVIEFVRNRLEFKNKIVSIIDVGTGSGCIAIALAKNLPNAQIAAIDLSVAALEIAQENAKTLGVKKQIAFLQNNLLDNMHANYDIIVANLPYISTKRIPTLDKSVKDFEPITALNGGQDGFDLYRKLFEQIAQNEIQFKFLAVEIDNDQKEIALREAKKYFLNVHAIIKRDFSGLNRYLYIAPASR